MSSNPGLVIGSTGFAIAMCGEIIRGYRFYCAAKSLKDDFQPLLIQMRFHQSRFQIFCQDAGLYGDGSQVAVDLRINKSLLYDILLRIKETLRQGARQNAKYIPFIEQDASKEVEVGPQVVDALHIEAIKVKLIQPSGPSTIAMLRATGADAIMTVFDGGYLSWAAADAESVQKIVGQLATWTDHLTTLLNDARLSRFLTNSDIATRVMLQQYYTPTQIVHVQDAFGPESSIRRRTEVASPFAGINEITAILESRASATARYGTYLHRLSEFREKYRLLGQQSRSVDPGLEGLSLNEEMFVEKDDPKKYKRPMMVYDARMHVWIEWKEEISNKSKYMADAEYRMQLLADLACTQKPEHFPTPSCLGYLKIGGRDSTKFGLVFKSPSSDRTLFKLKDLRELLLEAGFRPSMSDRMSLCASITKALLDLHTVEWIHKSIRSDNIIFWIKNPKEVPMDSPYLAGFQFSRPIDLSELSEKHEYSQEEQLYKHPKAASGAHKSHDIYSLALVLIEVVLWEPLDRLLGISNLRTAQQDQILAAQKKTSDLLPDVAFIAGDIIEDAIRACLEVDDWIVKHIRWELKQKLLTVLGEVNRRFQDTSLAMRQTPATRIKM